MAGRGDKFSRKQEQAVAALLQAPSIPEAARQAGIGERTLYRWLQEPTFAEAYRLARREVVSQATAQLQRAAGGAVATLQAIMDDSEAPASARVAAARTVLEHAIKWTETEDIEQRLLALEAEADRQGRPW